MPIDCSKLNQQVTNLEKQVNILILNTRKIKGKKINWII